MTLGDNAYFANGCGALISVNNGTLTLTPSGGETPLVIPASEVSEVRTNLTVGKKIGAFYIATISRPNPACARTRAPLSMWCAYSHSQTVRSIL
jgi:hypothetical protein